jgi:hypothetical protein
VGFVKRRGRDLTAVLVGLVVAEHGEQDVDAAAGEADEGGVVALP